MQIFVRNNASQPHGTLTFDVEPNDTISVLRRLICARIRVPPEMQSLRYGVKNLGQTIVGDHDDTQTLESYGITIESSINLWCSGSSGNRTFVQEADSWASARKRRAIAPHLRLAEQLTTERDYARRSYTHALQHATGTKAEAQRRDAAAAASVAAAAAEALMPLCSGIDAVSARGLSDAALDQLLANAHAAQEVLAGELRNRLDAERDRGPDRHLCVVCLQRPRVFMSDACNHFALCGDCLNRVGNCPICRAPATPARRVYGA